MQTKSKAELTQIWETNMKAARDIAAKAEAASGDFSAEDRAAIGPLMEAARTAKNGLLEIEADGKIFDELNALGLPIGQLAKSAGTPDAGPGTLGERFTDNAEFKAWFSSVAPNGQIPDSTKGIHSPAMAFAMKELTTRGAKDLVTGASPTSAGGLLVPDWLGLLDGLAQFQRPLNVVDLITKGTTGVDQVEYARVTGITNNAAMVPEATTAGTIPDPDPTNSAGVKPESALQLEKVTANVKTLAHWIPATKRALSDAGQIRTLIDQFLRYGLDEKLEEEIVTGDGTGEHFDGFLDLAGQHVAFDGDLLATARHAKTRVRLVGRARATAYLLHPNDNERIDLMKDDTGRYYFGGPSAEGLNTPMWGLPRVESESIPEGTGVCADFRTCVLWDREQASIQVSDSHADFFIRNLVAILAEMRAAFGVIRPLAIATFDIVPGS